jgi:hypothetical protein
LALRENLAFSAPFFRTRGGAGWRQGLHFYGNAIARLKRALIPGLQSGKAVTGLFAEVFR